jgi:hypothetical protein
MYVVFNYNIRVGNKLLNSKSVQNRKKGFFHPSQPGSQADLNAKGIGVHNLKERKLQEPNWKSREQLRLGPQFEGKNCKNWIENQ